MDRLGAPKTGHRLGSTRSADSGHSRRARHCPLCPRRTSEHITHSPAFLPAWRLAGLAVSPRDVTSEDALSSEPWAQSVVTGGVPGGEPCSRPGAAPCFVEQACVRLTQAGQSVWGKQPLLSACRCAGHLGALPFPRRGDPRHEPCGLWVGGDTGPEAGTSPPVSPDACLPPGPIIYLQAKKTC